MMLYDVPSRKPLEKLCWGVCGKDESRVTRSEAKKRKRERRKKKQQTLEPKFKLGLGRKTGPVTRDNLKSVLW